MTALLEVEGVVTQFPGARGPLPIVDGSNFRVERGEVLALVGESGCGKSMTALSLMRLVPKPGRIVAGQIRLEGQDLMGLPVTEMRQVRGRRIAMIFQEPMTSLNPVIPVGEQVVEAIRLHESASRREARTRCRELFAEVGIPDPEERLDAYPHQLSGGQRQRVVIAIAMACGPDLLVADEPTTALDVTIQAQILRLLSELVEEEKMSLILITHDLGVIAENTDRMLVMYAGRCVESGLTEDVFSKLKHPYTRGLFEALPEGEQQHKGGSTRLKTIPGRVPKLDERSRGCVFQTRCASVQPRCREEVPQWVESDLQHSWACWFPKEAQPVPSSHER